MKDYEKSRKNYEQRKKSGDYDANMEYNKENDVESGAWVLITRQVPVEEKCKPHLFGIYWGKVTLNLRGGVKASISQNSKGEINVERTETKKQKLTE